MSKLMHTAKNISISAALLGALIFTYSSPLRLLLVDALILLTVLTIAIYFPELSWKYLVDRHPDDQRYAEIPIPAHSAKFHAASLLQSSYPETN
ncbi:MAG: hypothetical protein B6I38_05910 [Anaerolineaceae bacterium 4572_5.1]|nr:MAG: hypothetical protein B6I38_05910 [Anaerolineaceae bacterium 4572_5.1]